MGTTNLENHEKWGIPNWRNPDEYLYVKNLTEDQLRWEFLRRDATYRRLAEANPRQKTHFLIGNFLDPKISGDQLPQDFMFIDNARRGYGLALRPPPINSILFKKGEADPSMPGGAVDGYLGAQVREIMEDGFIVIPFNPFKALPPQIKAAKKRLLAARDTIREQDPSALKAPGSNSKNTIRDPAKLLRVIDAHHDGLTPSDIGVEFYSQNSDNYSDAAATGSVNLKRALSYWKTL